MNCTYHHLSEPERALIQELSSLLIGNSENEVADILTQTQISGLSLCESHDAPPCFDGDDWTSRDMETAMRLFRELNDLAKEEDDEKAAARFLDSAHGKHPETPRSLVGRIVRSWKQRRTALGLFIPDENKIVLFPDVISVVSEEIGVDAEDLTGVVLVHEIGHWLHRHVVTDWPPPGCYASHEDELKECIAQLVCKLLSDSIADDPVRGESLARLARFHKAFVLLLPGQPKVYRAFEPFAGIKPKDFLDALRKIRACRGCAIDQLEQALEDNSRQSTTSPIDSSPNSTGNSSFLKTHLSQP